MNWTIAKHATFNLLRLLCGIGLLAILAFLLFSKWIVTIPALASLGLTWFVLYRFEIAWRENRLRKGWYF